MRHRGISRVITQKARDDVALELIYPKMRLNAVFAAARGS